jgi:hypothetical protein
MARAIVPMLRTPAIRKGSPGQRSTSAPPVIAPTTIAAFHHR